MQCLCQAVQCSLAGGVFCSLEPMQRKDHALWSHGRCQAINRIVQSGEVAVPAIDPHSLEYCVHMR